MFQFSGTVATQPPAPGQLYKFSAQRRLQPMYLATSTSKFWAVRFRDKFRNSGGRDYRDGTLRLR
jgi:hypothetical protein